MATIGTNGAAASATTSAGISIDTDTVVQPVARAGRQLYGAVAGPVEWYVEQWEDLLVEARASVASGHAEIDVAGMLAGLTQATVRSSVPGRLRLRLPAIKGDRQLAKQIAQTLESITGIERVDVSSLTGSILIGYDTTTHATAAALLQAVSVQPGSTT